MKEGNSPKKKLREVHIVWKFQNNSGNGLWYPVSSRKMLEDLVQRMNIKYGEGSHWLEERDA